MHFLLLGTAGCHLCEEAEVIVSDGLTRSGVSVAVDPIDIADDPQWFNRYAVHIPVLYDPASGRELEWPFDAAAVDEFISAS